MFLNPLMLAALAGTVVPLVLHLLARARYRSIDWGAMMFLESGESRQRRSTRLKQWILLALRMLLLAVLALAMARPVVQGHWGGLPGHARVTAVIILDKSASTSLDENGRSRFDLAREAALQVLRSLRKGDQVSLLLTGDLRAHPAQPPTTDLQSIARMVELQRPGAGKADIAEALGHAAEIFDKYEPFNRELYVIADRQALSWKNATPEFAGIWKQRMARPEHQLARFVVIPVGSDAADNVAIEAVDVVNPPAVVDQPCEVQVRVRNYGPAPATALPLKFINPEHATTVNLAAYESATVTIPVTFYNVGSQILTAQIKAPGLSIDKRFDTAVEVVDPVKVRIISGDERDPVAEPFRGASDFFRLAIAPYKWLKRAGNDIANVDRIIPSSHWTGGDLEGATVVVMTNVPQVSKEQAQALEQYVYEGGSLLIAPGNLSDVQNYNAMLYRNGEGILPAQLSSATAENGSQATSLLGIDTTHPIFHFLKGRPDPIPTATIARYFPTMPRPRDARVLASYASGQKFLIEGTSGRGKVLLLTTPLDAGWNTLPLTNFYLPFCQSLVRYLAAGTLPQRNLAPGEALVEKVPEPLDLSHTFLSRGQNQPLKFTSALNDGVYTIRSTDTDEPGVYQLRLGSPRGERQVQFVVQPDRAESDLAPLTADQWKEFQQGLNFERLEPGSPAIESLATSRHGRELWLSLVALAICLGLIEMTAARFWSNQEGA